MESIFLISISRSAPEAVGFFDVVNYCVNNDSSYTNDSFKSYKALDAYKYYVEGWIKEIACRKLKDGFVVITKVRYSVVTKTQRKRNNRKNFKVGHSQKMSAKPLHCWVSIEATGIVLCGHCSCMAGLGEVCTHIGATLFLLADWCRRSKELNISVGSHRSSSCEPNCKCMRIEWKKNIYYFQLNVGDQQNVYVCHLSYRVVKKYFVHQKGILYKNKNCAVQFKNVFFLERIVSRRPLKVDSKKE